MNEFASPIMMSTSSFEPSIFGTCCPCVLAPISRIKAKSGQESYPLRCSDADILHGYS